MPSLPLLGQFAVYVSAVSGVVAARGKSVDLFGVLDLARVTALGSGTLRDMMAGAGAVARLHSPALLGTICIIAVVAFFACRKGESPATPSAVAAALPLCAFAVSGTRTGLSLAFEARVAPVLGVITGFAAGITRDFLMRRVLSAFKKEAHLYATAALSGGIIYYGTHGILGKGRPSRIAASGAIILRLVSIRSRLSLPVFEEDARRKNQNS